MIWPFTQSRKSKDEETKRREAEDAADRLAAAASKRRRDAAKDRILANLRKASDEREATVAAEAEHCQTIGLARERTDTIVRRVERKHSEMASGVFTGTNGKSTQELAEEELARSEADEPPA